jgi:hypothetical protein
LPVRRAAAFVNTERMSRAGRICICAAAAALTVAAIFALLVAHPIPLIGQAFVRAGYPLGQAILEFAPDGFIRTLAPQGGPEAVGWAMALGMFATWFAVFFAAWLLLLWRVGRRRPVSA